MSALAMHFSTTWHPGDAADPSLAAEYPPLYPMIVGRIAAWTGRPAWTLLQPAQVVITSFAVVAGFLLWRRLVGDVAAFLISTSVFVIMVEPSKGNEILSLSVYLPWLLGTFAVSAGDRPPRSGRASAATTTAASGRQRGHHRPGRALVTAGPVPVPDRRGPARGVHLVDGRAGAARSRLLVRWGVTIVVSLVVASWFVFPLAKAYLTGQVEVVADLWLGSPSWPSRSCS